MDRTGDQPVILIIDDEPTNLAALTSVLGPQYQVRAGKTGAQALAIAAADPKPDLILLDVLMPEMDGYTVLAGLRRQRETATIPVIFISSLDDSLDEEIGLRLGAVDYITKPIHPAVLLARVKAHLEIKRARDFLKQQNEWLEDEVARRTSDGLLVQNVGLSIILGLAETRDTDTGNHIMRTQAYVESLGRQLRSVSEFSGYLTGTRLAQMVAAVPLHDIGKIGIPDRVLLKPGKLDDHEWETMKTHAELGGQAIRRALDTALRQALRTQNDGRPESLEVLELAYEIAVNHHEKWDGSGYPRGLIGSQIPISARIMALADVYDALTTARVYKRPSPAEQAAALIREQRARHFDPDVVDAFLAVRDQFAAIQTAYGDAPLGDDSGRLA